MSNWQFHVPDCASLTYTFSRTTLTSEPGTQGGNQPYSEQPPWSVPAVDRGSVRTNGCPHSGNSLRERLRGNAEQQRVSSPGSARGAPLQTVENSCAHPVFHPPRHVFLVPFCVLVTLIRLPVNVLFFFFLIIFFSTSV